ncbi:MAG: DUF4251 domain-containing protein [Nonlabens sp.]
MKKPVTHILWMFLALIAIGCGTSKNPLVTKNTLNKIQNLAEERAYVVSFNTAYPQNSAASQRVLNSILMPTGNNASRINITGSSATITVDGDMSTAEQLPFFGEQRLGGGSYGQMDSPLDFDSAIRDYRVERRDEKITVTYGVTTNDSDNLDVRLDIYEGYNVRAMVISTKRTNMLYDGTFKATLSTEALDD